ncbi:30S ribosomal protein S4 [Candidatus Woesearchaeota archaeon]|nr:30S ribosomal protein S4 [Candidatus Woesearchaeota archaeon]MCF7901632.1 30S ribosomal protein S4 [Candidatus Woesearchaeota archaeon]MCF8012990.1 30S ribosomal protein S4 [Candidatus Woesearchaeota archaeon]
MGDPRKITNKFEKPMHPWQKDRIDSEKPLMKLYGLKNKKELWKAGSILKNFKNTAKSLVARNDSQAEKEKSQLIKKLKSLNLVKSDVLDEILGLQIEQLLDRRLQTVLFKKGLARTIDQARQMITHKHVIVAGKMLTAPGYIIRIEEEMNIEFYKSSQFTDPDHPERKPIKKEEPEEVKKEPVKKKEESKPSEEKKEEVKEE